jgi:hypothetical protein
LVLGETAGDCPAFVLHLSLNDGPVLALDIVLLEQVLKLRLYRHTLRKNEQPAYKFVQTMDDEELCSRVACPKVLAQVGVGGPLSFVGRGNC